SSAASAKTTPVASAAGAPPQPKSGGTLRYGSDVDVNRLDPHFRLGDIYYSVYDRLTQYDVNHNVQPMLAESWDISPDFTSIKFVEWRQNDSLTLTKNTNYWQSGKPYLDGIVMSVITDSQAMVTRFEGGTLDAAVNYPVTDFIRLRDDKNYTPLTFSAGNFSC